MLHINYFKFGLKEDSRNFIPKYSFQKNLEAPNVTRFEKIITNDHPAILVTLGPKSADFASIQKISRYTKFFRLNGSHNTINWHVEVSRSIRKACPEAIILLDIPGIKPRTNNPKVINIDQNELVDFCYGPNNTKDSIKKIELTKPLPKISKEFDSFSLSDGLYEFDLLEHKENCVRGKARTNLQLLPKKGLNLPGSIYDNDLQLEVYLEFLDKVKKVDFNAIGLSFIQNRDTLEAIRVRYPHKLFVAKIENKLGVKNVEQIVKFSDIIMIDRGDLLAEVGVKNFYKSVVEISATTKSHQRPLIMATENLESMQYRMQPSKSEIIALQHSVDLGSDLLMLSDETATSDLYMNTICWLHKFLKMNK